MGSPPCLKLSFLLNSILASFLFTMVSCSTIDLPTLAPPHTENQSSSEIVKKPSPKSNKQNLNLENKLREKDQEIILLQEEIGQLIQLRKTLDDKNREIVQLNSELSQIRNAQSNQSIEIGSLKKKLDEKIAIASQLREKLSKRELDTKLEQLKLNERLDQREKEIESKEIKLRLEKERLNDAISKKASNTVIKENNLLVKQGSKKSNAILNKPSFNCDGVVKWDEKIICRNSSLAHLDRNLDGVYRSVIKSANNNDLKEELKKRQTVWLNKRYQCKEDMNEKVLCLKRIYVNQISLLQDQLKKHLDNTTVEKKQPPVKINKKRYPRVSTLFQKLPVSNFKKYNDKVVLDVENSLLWTRVNFHQKERYFPENFKECLEWKEQMRREKYGGLESWRVPSHSELSYLTPLYQKVAGGESENFSYWGAQKMGSDKLTLYSFKNESNKTPNNSGFKANCRLVTNLKNRK
jgi:uncharacterized protein